MTRTTAVKKWMSLAGSLLVLLAFAVGVVVLLLWLAGKFSPKVPMTSETDQPQSRKLEGDVVPVRLVKVPRTEKAAGTVRAVHETTIGSKLLAMVKEINITAGQKVREGEVLIRLDDADLKAKLNQAKAAIESNQASYDRAVADEKRYARLLPSKAVSEQEYERVKAGMQSAEAELRRAQAALNEVQAMLDWATIRSPIDGTIIDKRVYEGDMVSPGQILATLFDPKRMQLVATVRESLVHQLKPGQNIGVEIDTLEKQCTGMVSEIVPEAHTNSRSFQVKVTGPCPPGIYSGMFGRIEIPLGKDKEVLVIPSRAVQHVGQLDLVNVVEGDRVVRRSIRIGSKLPPKVTDCKYGEEIEVLSGLQEGEKVVVPVGGSVTTPGATCPTKEAAHD